jgi:hypothetical protein
MAYNRSNYNPDALPAHVEPDQAAAILGRAGDRDHRPSGRLPPPKPQPPLPPQQQQHSPPGPRYDQRRDDRYNDPPPPRRDDPRRPPSSGTRPPSGGGGGGRGGAADYGRAGMAGIGSPPPGNYGYERTGPPPGGAHGRPPTSVRPPPTPAPGMPGAPRDGNDREALWPMFKTVDRDRASPPHSVLQCFCGGAPAKRRGRLTGGR